MNRLTIDKRNFCDIAKCSSTPGGSFCEDGYCDQRRCYERLREYERIGTVEKFRTLKDVEQKRREGCQRCWNGECMMSGADYRCETTCDKCRYSLRDKHFCPDCGRDLKGEQK